MGKNDSKPQGSQENPDLIDDGVNRFVLLEITDDHDWKIVERWKKHPELSNHIELNKKMRGELRTLQMGLESEKRYIVAPRIRTHLQHYIERIEDILRDPSLWS